MISKTMNVVILENIRSAYNVGNIIRTADALGRKVRLTWYSPSPAENNKVIKTSLGAENNVDLIQFWYTTEAIAHAKSLGLKVIAAEITDNAIALDTLSKEDRGVAVVFGNEVDWVLSQTQKEVDQVVYIPMKWIKESLNVGQSSAIFMRELQKYFS
jgi:tRNA G18 (ribose-2'-O)-methylase SpoU